MDPAAYSAQETLRDGRTVRIRALRPDDRAAMVAFADRMSDAARQLRFFAPRRGFSEREIDYFVNVDFVSHVAAVLPENSAMLKVLQRSGLPMQRHRESGVAHVTLKLS